MSIARSRSCARAVQPNVAIISYDEKPGIQAIRNTSPDLPPKPGVHAGWARDHEYKRHGTRGYQNFCVRDVNGLALRQAPEITRSMIG